MKIAIGTNYFGEYERQSRAMQCLLRIKAKYSNVSLYDIRFTDEIVVQVDKRIIPLPFLMRSSLDVVEGGKKKLQFMNDSFKILSRTECDVFILINSDILMSTRLIEYVMNNEIKAMPCNRVDIHPIKDINDPLVPYRMEIGGFDAFVFNTKWFKENEKYFEDFFWGSIWVDHHYAGVMKLLTNDKLGNDFPPFLFHEMHDKNWTYDDPEAVFNKKQWREGKYHYLSNAWDDYFASYLKDKRRNGFVFNCDQEETLKEMEFFKQAKEKLNQNQL